MKNYSNIAIVLAASSIMTSISFAAYNPNFSPYADMTVNTKGESDNPEPMDLSNISQKTGIKAYHLAFISDAGICSPAWGGSPKYAITLDKSFGIAMANTLRSNGVTYFISFGGEFGTDLSKQCDLDHLIYIYDFVISTYQPIGLDFDIENDTADVDKVMQAIHKIHDKYPKLKISFSVLVQPSGLNAMGRAIVQAAKANNFDYKLNLMAMDYTSVPYCVGHMGQCTTTAVRSTELYLKAIYPEKSDAALWGMIEITPMIGVNNAPLQTFTLTDAKTVVYFAQKYKINGLSMWSITRDQPCSNKTPNPICSGNSVQTMPFEFTQRFLSTQ